MLFSELAEMYLADKRDGRKAVRLNTYEGYESAINRHLLPRWSQAEVESIDFESVQSWVDSFPEGRGAEKALVYEFKRVPTARTIWSSNDTTNCVSCFRT